MPFNKSAASLLALLHPVKRLVVIVLDLILAWVSVWAAFYLRVDQVSLPQFQQKYVYLLAPIIPNARVPRL